MASIHKQKGRSCWFCAFYDPEGFRRFRSTGTENSRIARTICVNIERGAILAKQGKLSSEKALRLIRETCDAIGETHGKLASDQAHHVLRPNLEQFVKLAGGELQTYTIRSWFDTWLESRTDASKATVIAYRGVLDSFLKWLGARADRPLSTLTPKNIEDFKAEWGSRAAPSTVNRAIKVLKASLGKAVASRQLEFSPAEHVSRLQTEECNRRPFTPEELQKVIAAAKGDKADWRTMILLGYYTGLRLNDCADLTWRNVELHTGALHVRTQKTGREVIIPLAEALAKHLSNSAGDNPEAPLCPGLFGKPSAWLSAQFYEVMVNAGLVPKRGHQSTGKGREAKREKNPISFHSLRYNATSALKSAGVSDAVAMDIIGHETAAISRNYTTIELPAKRAAISKLPDITK